MLINSILVKIISYLTALQFNLISVRTSTQPFLNSPSKE